MYENAGQLGVVAIGRNEGERLKACLRSIPQSIPIVYVDSGSTDGSVEFASSLGALVVELDTLEPFTAARARNKGFQQLLLARPHLEFVQFIDGDCELERGWLTEGKAYLVTHSNYAAVCGRRRERFPNVSFYNRMCDAEWDTPIGDATACGGDALYRVQAIDAVGGFDPWLIAGEEPELCLRLRNNDWKIRRQDVPMTVHDANMTRVQQWWKRSIRCGFGYAQVWRKTAASDGSSLYGRQLASALFWTLGLVASAIILALILSPWALLLAPAAWALQLLRLSSRFGLRQAMHLLGGKFAETLGALRYATTVLRGRSQGAIFYK